MDPPTAAMSENSFNESRRPQMIGRELQVMPARSIARQFNCKVRRFVLDNGICETVINK